MRNMIRVVAILLAFTLSAGPMATAALAAAAAGASTATKDDCQKGMQDAQIDADAVGGGNFWGGFALGFCLPLVGNVLAYVIPGPSEPRYLAASEESDKYKNCYTQVYLTETKSRKRNKSFIGSLIGLGCIATIAVIADKNRKKDD